MIICILEPEVLRSDDLEPSQHADLAADLRDPAGHHPVLSTVSTGPIRPRACCSRSPASPIRSTATSRAAWARPRGSARSSIPVADKLIVAVALVLLVSKDMPTDHRARARGHGRRTRDAARGDRCSVILVLCSIVIIGREIAISALREWMAEIGQRGKVKVSQLAKLQDHPADRRPVLHVVPLEPADPSGRVPADIRDRPGAHHHRRVRSR